MDDVRARKALVMACVEEMRVEHLPPKTRAATRVYVLVRGKNLTVRVARATLPTGVDGGGAESLSLLKA